MEICCDTLALMCEAIVSTGLSGRRPRWLLLGLVLIMGPKALPRPFVLMKALARRAKTFFGEERKEKMRNFQTPHKTDNPLSLYTSQVPLCKLAEQYFLHEPLDDRYAPHKADVQQVNFFYRNKLQAGSHLRLVINYSQRRLFL